MEDLLNRYPDYAYIALFFMAAVPIYYVSFGSPVKNYLLRHFVFGTLLIMNILFGMSIHPDGREMFELYKTFSETVLLLSVFYVMGTIIIFIFLTITKNRSLNWTDKLALFIGLPIFGLLFEPELFVFFSLPLMIYFFLGVLYFVHRMVRQLVPSLRPPDESGSVIGLVREGGDLKITLSEQWVDLYYSFRLKYNRLLNFLANLFWPLTKYFPFSLYGTGRIGHYKNRQIMLVWDKIVLVSGKLKYPLKPIQVGQVDAFLVYICEIRTRRKAPWQDKFLKLLAGELETENIYIRPSAFVDGNLDIMVPRE